MDKITGSRLWVTWMLLFVLLFSGTLFFTNLGKRDLWRPDELRYAEVAREMVLTHQYLVPRINEREYTQKPPLFFWMVAGSFKVFQRINEWTARFPVALSAVLCVLFAFLIAKRLFDPWTGFFSALLLATTSEFFWLANRVNLDTTMTLFILISLYAILRGLEQDGRRNFWFRLAFFSAGVATVTKGPLGILVPFLTLIVYLILKGEFGTLKKIPWVSGFAIFLLVLVVGLGPTCFFGGKAFTRELLFQQTVTRYLHGLDHRKGFFYYFYTYPEALLPWILFLPGAILLSLKKGKGGEFRSSYLFILVWALANLLFISFSKSKRQLYILSLLPAGCIYVGSYISAVYQGTTRSTPWFRIPVYLLGVLAIVAGIALPFAPYGIKIRYPDLVLPYQPFVGMGILVIVAGALLCFLNGTKKTKATVWVLILSFYAVFFVGARWVIPLFNPLNSLRTVGEQVQVLKDRGVDVRVLAGVEHEGILFYTRMTMVPVVTLVPWEMKFLKTSPKAAVVLKKRNVGEFAQLAHVPLKVLWQAKIGKRTFMALQPAISSPADKKE